MKQLTAVPEAALLARAPAATLQRCGCKGGGECASCRRKRQQVQRRADSAAPTRAPHDAVAAPPVVGQVLRGGGRPLDAALRSHMERGFGHDFSHVRVHSDATAAASARAVSAAAYTVGSHIVFGAGRYQPHAAAGQHLLAHELAHTIQQRGAALPQELTVGPADDAWERQADRAASAVTRGGVPALSRSPHTMLRRTPAAQTPLHEDVAHLPAPEHGENARIHVFRKLFPCECRNVPDVREGVFWKPEMDAFAIAYRHCRGGTTTDVYAEVESNLSAFLTGGTPPVGTARTGFEINVVGRNVGGRVLLEMRGSNVSGSEGVGGRVQVVFQGDSWRVFATADYLRRLGTSTGDRLTVDLGARIGPITVEAQVSNALSDAPTGSGAACIDLGGPSVRGCGTLDVDERGGVTGGIGIRGEFGGPSVRREETCFQCLCPPPVKRYECILDIPPESREVERDIEVNVPGEFRYFFRLNRATPAEDPELRARSTSSLGDVASEVAGGGTVDTVAAYASPEATEAHNQGLSEERAIALLAQLRSTLPANTPLPDPIAGGELLGSRPTPAIGSRLGDIITEHGFRSAENLSVLLLGEEIPRAELAEQFVSLFQALPEPADRLAVFGFTVGDPLEPSILRAIDAFLANPRAGTRPWERVFRLLRVGVVRTSRPETRQMTVTERTSGSFDTLSDAACREYAEQAEADGSLPAVPEELRMPRRGGADRRNECDVEVSAADRAGGCSYTIPESMRLRPTAPSRAPNTFPSLRR